jgi:hypothetical protein
MPSSNTFLLSPLHNPLPPLTHPSPSRSSQLASATPTECQYTVWHSVAHQACTTNSAAWFRQPHVALRQRGLTGVADHHVFSGSPRGGVLLAPPLPSHPPPHTPLPLLVISATPTECQYTHQACTLELHPPPHCVTHLSVSPPRQDGVHLGPLLSTACTSHLSGQVGAPTPHTAGHQTLPGCLPTCCCLPPLLYCGLYCCWGQGQGIQGHHLQAEWMSACEERGWGHDA